MRMGIALFLLASLCACKPKVEPELREIVELDGFPGREADIPNDQVALSFRGPWIRSLKNIEKLRHLKSLDLQMQQIEGPGAFDNLASLKELESLDVGYLPIDNLDMLRGLPLKELHIEGTKVQDLEALREMRTLQELGIVDTQIKDLSPLSNMADLRILSLARTPALQNMDSLKVCVRILYAGKGGAQIPGVARYKARCPKTDIEEPLE